MFKNMKLATKLLSGFIIVAVIAGIIGFVGISNIKTIVAADTMLYEKGALGLQYTGQISASFNRLRVNVIKLSEAENQSEISAEIEKINKYKEIILKNDELYKKTYVDSNDRKAWEEYTGAFNVYEKFLSKIIELASAGKFSEVKLLVPDAGKQAVIINDMLEKNANFNAVAAKEISDANTAIANSATMTMIILIIVGILLAIGLGLMITVNIKSIVNMILKESEKLITATVDGKLDVRGESDKINFEFREIVVGMNRMLDAVIGPLNVAAEYVDRISKGDVPPKITEVYKGDFNEIKNNVNVLIDSINNVTDIAIEISKGNLNNTIKLRSSNDNLMIAMQTMTNAIKNLVTDAAMLAKAAEEGKLDTRADATKHNGDFRAIVKGVNKTLDNVIGPLNVAAEYVDRIAKGDIPPKITDKYNGDFNEIKNNLNQCIDAVNALVADAAMLAKAAVDGKLDTRADATKHGGDFRAIVEGVNATLDNVIGPLNVAAEYVDRIAKGDIPPKITDNYNGDFNEIKNNLNDCIDSLNSLVNSMIDNTKNQKSGDIEAYADLTKFSGVYKELIKGYNEGLEIHINTVLFILNLINEYSEGNLQNEMPVMPGKQIIATTRINKLRQNIINLINDTAMLAKAAAEGSLATRADATKHSGDFRAIVDGVNKTLDDVIGPLNVAADYVEKISKGDIPPKITNIYNGDFNEIKNNLNQAIDAINLLVSDAKILAKAAEEGKLDTRADAMKHNGDFRAIVTGVNKTLDNVIGPLNVAAEYVDRIAKGDIPPKITDNYKGDFNEIKNNLNALIEALNNVTNIANEISKGNLNNTITLRSTNDNLMIAMQTMTNVINGLLTEINMLIQATKEGKLDTRGQADKFAGGWGALVGGINELITAFVGPINVTAEYIDRIAKGDIPPKITDNYKGDFNEIKNNLNSAIEVMNGLLAETNMLIQATKEGKLDTRGHAEKFSGGWGSLISGVNDLINAFVSPISVTAEYVDRISKGDIPPKITHEYKGDFNEVKNNLNQCIDAINLMVTDGKILAVSAINGKLDIRIDASKHNGEFKAVLGGFNNTLDSIMEPINEASEILEVMSTGNLTARMQGEYKGDNQKLKNSINGLGNSLTDVIVQVNDTVQTTASSAFEISSSAESLAAATQEQSNQTDEVASAVEEMSRTVSENAMGAKRTADLARKSGEIATNGATVVKQTVNKMRDIADVVKTSANNIQKLGDSSKEIGEIISVIDDIADQTNLLALNAAIEAARAGEQGRGFAVVADEVRKLAERTTAATKQIAKMIKGIQAETDQAVVAMNKGTLEVQNGIELADKAGESLNHILSSTKDVLDNINQIASASEEQSATSEEISRNVMSISKVTGESAKRIEDVAHTSEELAKLTEQLRNLMAQFQVEGNDSYSYSPIKQLVKKDKLHLTA